MSFQQNTIVLIPVAMATNFEHKLNGAEEFYKLAKFQANTLQAYPSIALSFFPVFGSVAMTSYFTSWKET